MSEKTTQLKDTVLRQQMVDNFGEKRVRDLEEIVDRLVGNQLWYSENCSIKTGDSHDRTTPTWSERD